MNCESFEENSKEIEVSYDNAIGLDYASDGLYVNSDGNKRRHTHTEISISLLNLLVGWEPAEPKRLWTLCKTCAIL